MSLQLKHHSSHFWGVRSSRCAAVLAALCLFTGLMAVVPVAQAATIAQVQILDRETHQKLPMYQHQGQWWVAGSPGASYAVEITNRTGKRILAVVSVDGVNTITGETAAAEPANGYVLRAWKKWPITGWRKSDEQVAAFYFTALEDAYAARTGRPRDVGVIGVTLFRERVSPPAPSIEVARDNQASQTKVTGDTAAQPNMRSPQPIAPQRAEAEMESAAPAMEAEPAVEVPTQAALEKSNAHVANNAAVKRAAQSLHPRLGTGHGALENSASRKVAFESATQQPVQIVTIRYDSYENLVAKGIIPAAQHKPQPNPNPFPASGYVPDPPRR